MNFRSIRKNTTILMLIPCVLLLLLLTVYPLIHSVQLSLSKWNLLDGRGAEVFVGFENYKTILTDPIFHEIFLTTLKFSLTTVLIEFFVGLGLALLLDQKLAGVKILRILIMVPMVVAPIVIGSIWRLLYHLERGHINFFLSLLHIDPVAWLSNPNIAFAAAAFVDIWKWSPLIALILLAGLQSIPRDIYEAGLVDGAEGFNTFRYITFPMLRPYIAVAVSIRMIDSFKTFDYLWMLTGGGPGRVTELLNLYTYRTGLRHFEMGYASTLALILVMLAAISGIIVNGILRRD